ncbi:D-aminoacyl-tRNA deacylase [dtd] [Acididesulfobacillus acetoxydans]|uniref:D-aminoacyl-tRNA deacylase n=1 Tax=Acididesulfobacillus acetoxydans TaxID=1561005 RepID=A0A8S0W3H9_9FIRM|nr:D-aminoacyl-tRNA deacylase [Acididesulfobacillus acetoxydans]CAA7601708.1 D-aminoacyl-tRNA deacylase [dtd] [Acididesulfobacillus acetoxydans]CEJ09073.1 D-tyrosyl-tRNA(Tyr) deacylase [Acididesulfobacillus acetoxydans]
MRSVVQRVKKAWVKVAGAEVGAIGPGLLVLLAVGENDGEKDLAWMVEKIVSLRIFADEEGKMNRSVENSGGEVLLVSQFTLFGDCRKGKRPSFSRAAAPERAKKMFEDVVAAVKGKGISVATGVFQAEMEVGLVNDGPVTLLLDSEKNF